MKLAHTTQRLAILCFMFLFVCTLSATPAAAAPVFKIGIMQAQTGSAKKFAPLESYMKTKGVTVKFLPVATYANAATLFDRGDIDGMFSGSAVAGVFILKGLAMPLVRPVDNQGRSTYWAVVIGRKGGQPFTARSAGYFAGKTVAYPALASSGEFFFKSLPDAAETKVTTVIAANHQDALEKLTRGEVDFAILKNSVWDSLQEKYPAFVKLGQDPGQNPNDTLIVSKKTDNETIKAVVTALIAVENDPAAAAVREAMGIKGFIMTSTNDFSSTLGLLKRAGITPQYNFK